MKTIKIESEYDGLFVIYQVWAYTKKGEIPFGCPSTNKDKIKKYSIESNEKAPYYSETYETTIYETYVREITVTIW